MLNLDFKISISKFNTKFIDKYNDKYNHIIKTVTIDIDIRTCFN